MKKLFTFVLALTASMGGGVYAQGSANWQAGDDVTAQIGLGDCDGTFTGDWTANDYDGGDVKTPGNYWKGSMPNEFRAVEDGKGVLAFYNQKEFDIYQVVQLPAGSYTIKVQSYYREGNPNDTFANWNNKGRVKKNAYLYASILNAAEQVERDFSKLIRSMAQTSNTVSQYTSDKDWASDAHRTLTYGVEEPLEVYFPSCNIGNYYHLSQGFYPNEMNIVLSEPAAVRMGIRKVASIPEDYVPLYDFQVIYNGPADNEAVLDAAREDCHQALAELEDFKTQLEDAGFEGFAGAVSDILIDFDEQIDDAESTEALDAILASINTTVDNYLKSLASVNSLDDLISMSEDMLASTQFPGYDAFQAAVEKAKADAKTDDVEALGDDPGAYFAGVYNTLAEARANYLDSQEKDTDGAKDFSALIKHPWFVNPEYTPTQNEDGTWTLKEETWNWGSVGNLGDYSTNGGSRTDICSKVSLGTDASINNQWYKRLKAFGGGWSANSFHLFYQAGLIGVSQGWCSGFDDWEGVCQQLVGLPNGYYSLKALVRGNNADPWNEDNLPPYHNIFAENSEEVRVTSIVGHTDGYYCQQLLSSNNGWYEWNPVIWQEHKTGTIQVSDGKLLIGGQSSMLANFTGFRLLFYGTEPPFSALIQKELDAINADKDGLTFKGDIKAIDNLLAKIALPIPDAAAYDAALVVINEANDYLGFAKQAMKNNKAHETYTDLMDKYTTEDELAILEPAQMYAFNLGENDDDVYTMVEPATAAAAKYSTYMELYHAATAYKESIGKLFTEQTNALKAGYKNAETMQKFIETLQPAYNRAMFADKGAATATEEAPLDVTSLIVNPDFYNNASNGWTGIEASQNEYGQQVVGNDVKGINSELWNKDPFTFSQKIVGLPAGTYELRVTALYRDGGAVNAELVEKYNSEIGTETGWTNNNAKLFAKTSDENNQMVDLKAIEALKNPEPSFTEGHFKLDKGASEYDDDDNLIEPAYEQNLYLEENLDENGNPKYPFDTKVGDYYYPSSMYGFYCACQKYPEVFKNSVQITIEDGETLEIGLTKTKKLDGDWVIFDDFQLFYLSGDTFKEMLTGVEEVAAPVKKGDKAIYNLAGQKVDASYKGIIIQDGVKRLNK